MLERVFGTELPAVLEKWVIKLQQFIGNDGQGVDVVAGIRVFAAEHFQGSVGRRQGAGHGEYRALSSAIDTFPKADSRTGRFQRHGAGDAEIDDLDLAIATPEAVAGLEVRMYEPVLVGELQGIAEGANHRPGFGKSERAFWILALFYHVVERLAV